MSARPLNIRGQSALEYLMTYGWALVVMVIVIAALVALDVFNLGASSELCGGFPSTLAYNKHVYRADGTFELAMINGSGKDINVTALTVDGVDKNFTPPTTANIGNSFSISKTGFTGGAAGSSYKARVQVRYDFVSGTGDFNNLRVSGTCLGKFN